MKTKLLFLFIILLILPLGFAVDFVPTGNINGKNVYNIYNFPIISNITNITAVRFIGDGSLLTGLVVPGGNTSFNVSFTDGRYYSINNTNNYYNSSTIPAYALLTYVNNINNLSLIDISANLGNWSADKPNYASIIYVNNNGNYSQDRVAIYSNITALQASNSSTNSRINSVNASLQTKMELDGLNSNVTLFKFNLSSSVTTFPQGQMGWDTNSNAMSIGYPYGSTLQLGKEMYKEVTNLDTVTLTEGMAVSIFGVSGNREAVVRTNISNETLSHSYIGIVTTATIAPNNKGLVTLIGDINGLDTNNLTEGMPLYVSSTPGVLTQTRPSVPNHVISVGVVTVKSQNVGVISVTKIMSSKLSELDDVNGFPLTTSGQFLVWNQTGQYWDATENISNYAKLSYVNGINNLSRAQVQALIDANGNYSQDRVAIYTNISALQSSNTTTNSRVDSLNSTKANLASPTFTGVVTIPTLVATDANFTGIVWINNINSTNTTGYSAASQFIENGVTLAGKYATFAYVTNNGNWSLDKTSYSTTLQANGLYAPILATYTNITVLQTSNTTTNTRINLVNTTANIIALYSQTQKDPQGFPDRTSTEANLRSRLNFTDATRTFTISPVGANFSFYIDGIEIVKTTTQSLNISNVSGAHFIYFDNTGTLQETQVFSDSLLCDNAIVAYVFWDAPKGIRYMMNDERHSRFMECMVHINVHASTGTIYRSGLAPANVTTGGSATLNSSAQFSISAGSILDEDYTHNINAYNFPAQIRTYYQLGVAGNYSFKQDNFPICYSGACGYTGANGRLGANTITGSGFTQCANNERVLTHIFATNSFINTTDIVAVTGTTCYASDALARSGADVELQAILTTGFFSAEFKPLYTFVYQTTTTATNTPKAVVIAPSSGGQFIDWRFSRMSGAAGSSSSGTVTLVATDLTMTANSVTGGSFTSSGTLGIDNTYIQQFNDTALINAVNTTANVVNLGIPTLTYVNAINNLSYSQIATNLGNWSADKSSYSTTANANALYAPISATYTNITNLQTLTVNTYTNVTNLQTLTNNLYANVTASQVAITNTNTTANNALPKAGGIMSGDLNISASQIVGGGTCKMNINSSGFYVVC